MKPTHEYQPSPMADSTGGDDIPPDTLAGDRTAPDRIPLTDAARHARIMELANAMAKRRGVAATPTLEEWLEAERQTDDEIAARLSRITSRE